MFLNSWSKQETWALGVWLKRQLGPSKKWDCSNSLVAQTVKHLPAMWETGVWSLGWVDPLEKEMATHSSILFWRMWTKEPGRLQSMSVQRVRHNWVTNTFTFTFGRKISHGGPRQVIHSNLLGATSDFPGVFGYVFYLLWGRDIMRHFSNVLLLDSGDDDSHFNYYWLLSSSVNVRLLLRVLEKHKNHKEGD